MLKARISLLNKVLVRSYATAASPHALVFLEHHQGDLDSASLSALTAASQLGGQVTSLVVGSPEEVPSVVEKAKRYASRLS
jgi:electron transfer flavoprotein alpha subunit